MVKTKRKSIISKSKSSSKPKLKQNERKLSAKDQNALAKISSKEKEARKKYGGKHPAKLRDDRYTDMATIDGDIMILGAGGKMGPTLATLASFITIPVLMLIIG